MEMHAGQLTVSGETVRAMVDGFLKRQFSSIRAVTGTGTDNAIFRIGEQFVARFPLQAEAVETTCQHLRAEAAAAPESDGRTQFATPEPVALESPGLATAATPTKSVVPQADNKHTDSYRQSAVLVGKSVATAAEVATVYQARCS